MIDGVPFYLWLGWPLAVVGNLAAFILYKKSAPGTAARRSMAEKRRIFTPCHIDHGATNPIPVHPEGLCASCDSIYAWRRRELVEQEIRQGLERRGA